MTGRRRELIRKLLGSHEIASQAELLELLRAQGLEATQATVSRDLRALGVVKGPAGYRLPEDIGEASEASADALDEVFAEHVLSVRPAVNLVVLKTGPGRAQFVAVELDRRPPEGVAGTVAGDDTIFIAAETVKRANTLADHIAAVIGVRSPRAAGVAI
ncbi:MAG: hypothetical protein AAFR38_06395 [Planctomycetota bacterium]